MSDEQRVRTMCGWIGVEISKSRVRTPGKAGYGLYRVRGSYPPPRTCGRNSVTCSRPDNCLSCYPERRHADPGRGLPDEWTPYAFTLGDIETAVRRAIERGMPDGPGELRVRREFPGKDAAIVPTRWTSAYRGRRDLASAGSPGTVEGFEGSQGLSAGCEGKDEPASSSVRSSVARRAAERAAALTRRTAVRQGYARVFKARRTVGLARRHAEKLARRLP